MAVNKSDPAALEYAKALLMIGQSKGCLGEIFEDLAALNEAYDSDPVFRGFITSPKVSQSIKVDVLEKALGGKIHEMTRNFLKLLIQKRREALLDNIVDAFQKYRDESENRAHVWVESAVALDDAQRDALKSKVAASTGKEVELHEIVNEQLLGGMRIRYGDHLLDSSLRRRITELSQKLLSREGGLERYASEDEVNAIYTSAKAAGVAAE